MNFLYKIDSFFWEYIGFSVICFIGLYLTIISKGLQFKILINFKSNIKKLFKQKYTNPGIHPIKLYFTSIGGMVGVGNIITVGSAVMIGGPGSIFWMWIASFMGMIIKYSEIYLSITYRQPHNKNGYNGGIMYYLRAAFNKKWISYLAAMLLCVYGAEIYQFNVLVDRFEHTFNINKIFIILILLIAVIYCVLGGSNRVANVCSIIMPIFLISYITICLYILILHIKQVPAILLTIITSAFHGHEAIGGFIGSSVLLSAHLGVSKAVYAGDIGVGYDSVVQSESQMTDPKQQAQLSIYALFVDTLICSFTTIILVITKAYYTLNQELNSNIMSIVLNKYIKYSDTFITLLLFFTGFTTIIAFLSVGIKAATFICNKYGRTIYIIYAIIVYPLFSYVPQDNVILIMSLSGGLLVLINIIGIIKLRKNLNF